MVMEDQSGPSGLDSESIPVPRVHDSLPEANGDMMNVNQVDDSRSKSRSRKKALYSAIRKQMEFYFSDANLSKDRFLGNLIATNKYVDLTVFLQFNKIRSLVQDTKYIVKALRDSTILSLSEDQKQVCRTTPVTSRDNIDDLTVYVQGLPPDIDHDWIINIFSRFGPVAYVSLPRYQPSRKLKGFAFIEFESIDSADKCLKEFEEQGCTLPGHTVPEELLSITTFSEDYNPTQLENANFNSEPIAQEVKGKRSAPAESTSDVKTDAPKAKKPRLNNSDSEEVDETQQKQSEQSEDANNDEKETDADNKNEENKKKKKRKRRARNEQPDIAEYGIRIMGKRDWKKLRNKYLTLQRKKMKELKQHLRNPRFNQWNSREKTETDDSNQKKNQSEQEVSTPNFNFSEGLIVKMELDKPCTSPKNFKQEFKNNPGVQYIDIREASSWAFVRFDTAANAENFVKKHSEEYKLDVLMGDEEKAYWNKITVDRDEKLGKKIRVKQRGRDKILKKAEKEIGKHIKFDEVPI